VSACGKFPAVCRRSFLGIAVRAGRDGRGDIKLLAACVLWIDLSGGWKLLVAIAISGGRSAVDPRLTPIPVERMDAPASLAAEAAEGIPWHRNRAGRCVDDLLVADLRYFAAALLCCSTVTLPPRRLSRRMGSGRR
jgi:hypothetical protein